MAYSCSDFVDSIIEALGVTVPEDSKDNPADQADLCLAAIEDLKKRNASHCRGSRLNTYQKTCARTYGGGDFAYVTDATDPWPEIENIGDTLFRFLMVELSKTEGCVSRFDAGDRIATAICDLQAVYDAINPPETYPHPRA